MSSLPATRGNVVVQYFKNRDGRDAFFCDHQGIKIAKCFYFPPGSLTTDAQQLRITDVVQSNFSDLKKWPLLIHLPKDQSSSEEFITTALRKASEEDPISVTYIFLDQMTAVLCRQKNEKRHFYFLREHFPQALTPPEREEVRALIRMNKWEKLLQLDDCPYSLNNFKAMLRNAIPC